MGEGGGGYDVVFAEGPDSVPMHLLSRLGFLRRFDSLESLAFQV